ncbi:MAG: hypothetical protein ACYC5Y_12240 [Symbiobacteriia bacterium]
MGPEKSGHDLAGGVIDGTDEGKGRGVVAEPVVVAAVDEEHETGLGHAFAAAAVFGRAAFEPRPPSSPLPGSVRKPGASGSLPASM